MAKVIKITQKGASAAEPVLGLKGLQEFVGGFIECVPLSDCYLMIVNEEGKLNDLPFNATATGLYRLFTGVDDVIFGNALILKSDGEDLIALSDEEAERFLELDGMRKAVGSRQ